MAYTPMKSPGVRVNTIDQSDYTGITEATPVNPICIIGGACRGPINVPTLISSTSGFLQTFGTPIDLAGLTATKSLGAGGSIYYVRAAGSDVTRYEATINDGAQESPAAAFKLQATSYGTLVGAGWTWNYAVTGTASGSSSFSMSITRTLSSTIGQTEETTVTVLDNLSLSLDPEESNYYAKIFETSTNGLFQLTTAVAGGADPSSVATVAKGTFTAMTAAGTAGASGASDGIQIDSTGNDAAISAALDTVSDPEVYNFMYITCPKYSAIKDIATKMVEVATTRDKTVVQIDYDKTLSGTYTAAEAKDGVSKEANAIIAYFDSVRAGEKTLSQVAFWAGKDLYTVDDYNNGALIPVPESVVLIPALARLYSTNDPWVAPASTNYITLEVSSGSLWSAADRDALYTDGINPITNYRGLGWTSMGQKTAQLKKTALDRLNVRQLVNYIKSALEVMSVSYLFSPIDQQLFNDWTKSAYDILSEIQVRRGLYGFEVFLDYSTTTQEYINNNTIHPIVRIRPSKVAEFIDIDLVIQNLSESA